MLVSLQSLARFLFDAIEPHKFTRPAFAVFTQFHRQNTSSLCATDCGESRSGIARLRDHRRRLRSQRSIERSEYLFVRARNPHERRRALPASSLLTDKWSDWYNL